MGLLISKQGKRKLTLENKRENSVSFSRSSSSTNSFSFANETNVSAMLSLVARGTTEEKEYASAKIVSLSANYTIDKAQIVREGGIRALIGLLCSSGASPEAKKYAASALSNLSYCNPSIKAQIAREGGIPPLIALIKHGCPEGKTQACAALLNLSVDEANKLHIAKEGGILPLISLMRNGTVLGKKYAAMTISNLGLNCHANQMMIANNEGILQLIELIIFGDAACKEKAAGALRNLAIDNNAIKEMIIKGNGITPLLALSRHGNFSGMRKANEVLEILIPPAGTDTDTGMIKPSAPPASQSMALCSATTTANASSVGNRGRTDSEISGVTDGSNDDSCCICLIDARTVLCLPCRHMCLCETCSSNQSYISQATRGEETCPICRSDVTSKISVFT